MNMDQVGAMAVFLHAIAMGSMSEASRRTGIPVGTISRKIGSLEKFLKVDLFEKGKRRFTPTEAGRRFAEAASSILRELENAERAIQSDRRGPPEKLRVGLTTLYGQQKIVPLISEFLDVHRQIGVHLLIGDEGFDLARDSLDMAIQFGRLPGRGEVSIALEQCRRGLYASPQYLQSRGAPAHPSELREHDCIACGAGRDARRWSLSSRDGNHTIEIKPRLTVGDAQVAIDTAVAGLGIIQLFLHNGEVALMQQHLRPLLSEFDEAVAWITLTHAERAISPGLRLLADFIVGRIVDGRKDAGPRPGRPVKNPEIDPAPKAKG